jgi:heme exporter protein C
MSPAATTGSKATRIIGAVAVLGVVWLVVLGLVVSPADQTQGDLVRLMYVHVPSAWLAYMSFILTATGSVFVLSKKSQWWDLVAASAAEIGVLFCGLALLTGMIWGRPTWGTYWEWGDARLVSTLVLFLMFVGYLAVRRIPSDPSVRAKRSAIVALIGVVNIPLVHFSVKWWRTLHQEATVLSTDFDPKLDDLMLFTLFFSLIVFTLVFAWLLIHRFRVAWLEEQVDAHALRAAIDERRREAELVGGAS